MNTKEIFPVTVVDGNPFLYIDYRIDHSTVPTGWRVYEVAEADGTTCFARISERIYVDHLGTLIGRHKLPVNEDGYYYPAFGSEEYERTFIDECSLNEFDDYIKTFVPEEYADMSQVKDGECAIFEGHRYAMILAIPGIETAADQSPQVLDVIVGICQECSLHAEVVSVCDNRVILNIVCNHTQQNLALEEKIRESLPKDLFLEDISMIPVWQAEHVTGGTT